MSASIDAWLGAGTQALEFRLSPLQRHVWSLQDRCGVLRCQITLALEGRVDTGLIRRALAELVLRHEILRTAFARSAGWKLPVQSVAPRGAVELRELDLSGLDPGRRAAEAERLAAS
ncbi:MAG TPA: condensation domain-containing protein, partial [Thermoanaerobaculia bacterium]|nr:condensation domain-containing protein [Thermoanaerobaculia bacterium]